MNARNVLVLAALGMTMLAGCSNDEEAGGRPVPDLAGTPIRIHAGIYERSLTRAAAGYNDNGALKGSNFGLFLTTTTDESNNPHYNAGNMEFGYDAESGVWTANLKPGEEQLLWKNSSARVEYYAYMPYDNAISSAEGEGSAAGGESEGGKAATAYPLAVSGIQTAESFLKEDFLYAERAEANAIGSDGKAGAINITFGHVLSYLTVKLKRGDTAKDIRFTSVKLEGCCRMERGFNLQTGKFTDEEEGAEGGSAASGTAESNGSITLYNPAGSTDNTGSTDNGENTDDAGTTEESYECLLIPQTFAGTLTVIIEGTDNAGKAKRYSFQATGKTLELLRGHGYTLTLTVGQNKAGIGEVALNNWQTGEWGNTETPETGTAEEVPPQADAGSHTLANFSAGQIAANPSQIDVAMGADGILIVTGPISQADMQAIVDRGKVTLVELDLSGTNGSGVSIPEYAFCTYDETYPKPQIKTLKLGGAVTSVDRYAFRGCNTLTEVQLEDVKTIGQRAFSKCDIKTLKLGAELESLGINAFSENVNLTDVDLSECTNLTSIESYAFEKCGISNLKLPENAQLTTLDTGAFQENHSLLTVTIPATVTRVIVDMFRECNELETIVFQGTTPPKVYSAVGYEGGCFDYCFNSATVTNLTNKSIYIPNVPEGNASIDQWNAFFGSEEWAGIYYGKNPA